MKTLKRRRRQCKTDYKKRLNLLKSGRPRIVFRRTNRYFIAQYIKSKEAKDEVVFGITSKNLIEYGFPEKSSGSLKSIPASYLTGLLLGRKIIAKKLKIPIIDFGMLQTLHKTRVFAFLEGLLDAGLKIECDEKYLPSEDAIKGKHLKNKIPFEEIKSKIEEK